MVKLISKITIIELSVLIFLYFFLNKFLFLIIILLLGFLFYKSHKSSSISLPKELENIKMKAFTENLNNASNSIKDIFTFEDNINIPHLKTENDILVKVHSASLNQVDYIYTITNEKIIARKPIISNFNEVCLWITSLLYNCLCNYNI